MARGATLVARIAALREAIDVVEGRADSAAVARGRAVVERAEGRLAISGESTVVAIAGATGSGKSSTVNALAGGEISPPGIRRPTTSHAVAAVFGGGSDGDNVLDWLEIKARHRINGSVETGTSTKKMLPGKGSGATADLTGLVLLDLPDHDSTEAAHRHEVDRLVEMVDMLVWVVDPQKYADAAIHDQYLRPLGRHAEVMVVLLNQVDRLSAAERGHIEADLKRLLVADGLDRVQIIAVSAHTGEGIATVRQLLAKQVAAKAAATKRHIADVVAAAQQLHESCAAPVRGGRHVPKAGRQRLDQALAVAAGVPLVSEAVAQAWRRRGGLATGWPVLAWLAHFRPDPLRRLHLDRWGIGGKKQKELVGADADPVRVGRSSLPATTSVEKARVDTAVRALVDEVCEGLPRPWADAVRDAARAQRDRLPDQLDRAVASTDLDLQRHRGWWHVVRVLQWLLVAVVLAGLGWYAVDFVLAYLKFPPLPQYRWREFPIQGLAVAGGVLAGLLVAGASRIGVEVGAQRRRRAATKRLRDAISEVSDELVLAPVQTELGRVDRAIELLDRAAGK